MPGWNDYEFAQFERLFLAEGVISGLAVSQHAAGANMSVDVAIGTALIEITNTNLTHGKTYKVYFEGSTSVEVLPITTADPTNPRKDRVVLRINVSINPDGSSSNIAVLEVLAGTPAGSPSAPAEPSNAITLAIVDIPASDTTIGTAQITDSRTLVQMISASVLPDIARLTAVTSIRSGADFYAVATGSSNAYAATYANITGPIAAGMEFFFKANFANTTTATLTVTLGSTAQSAKTIKKLDGATNLASGDIANGQIVHVRYDGTNFQMLSPIGQAAAGGVTNIGTVTAASANVGSSSTAENTMSPTWTGSNDIGSSKLNAAGAAVRLHLGGDFRLDSGNVAVRVKVGGTLIAAFFLTIAETKSLPWEAELDITSRSSGASNSLIARGFSINGDDGGSRWSASADATGAPQGAITRDTTAAQAITVTAQFSVSDSDHFCNIQTARLTLFSTP